METIARGLAGRVTGDVIDSVWLGQKPEPLKSSAAEIASTLEHSRIATVRRVGKHIVFDLERDGDSAAATIRQPRGTVSSAKSRKRTSRLKVASSHPFPIVHTQAGKRPSPAHASDEAPPKDATPTSNKAQWIVHLGMTGSLRVCEPQVEVPRHTHAIVKLSSGRELRFIDPRRFGRLSVVKSGDFNAGGYEPLEVELERFTDLFRGRKTPIKSALLNQKLLRGVGNIYADESLFRAGIRPRRRGASISREQLRKLFLSVKEVLQEAIALGGSSVSDYVDADGDEGFFQLQHRVYGREGEPCLVCKTPVKRVVIAGRSSHYCPKCQK